LPAKCILKSRRTCLKARSYAIILLIILHDGLSSDHGRSQWRPQKMSEGYKLWSKNGFLRHSRSFSLIQSSYLLNVNRSEGFNRKLRSVLARLVATPSPSPSHPHPHTHTLTPSPTPSSFPKPRFVHSFYSVLDFYRT
jgi:hypothetical protein